MSSSSSSAPAAAAAPTPGIDAYLFGPFRLEIASLQLWRGDTLVPLPPKVFDTLLVLITNRQRLMTKDELLSAVWPNSFVSEESVAQNITTLRRALGDDHTNPTYIATIARRGYRFIGSVTEQSAEVPARPSVAPAAARVPELPSPAPPAASWWRAAALTASAAAAAAIAILAVTGARAPDSSPPAVRLSVDAPAGEEFVSGVFSPTGTDLLVVTEDTTSHVTRLALRALTPNRTELRVVPESDGAARPFWSPDGQHIAFFARGRLKRTSAAGGPVLNIASIAGPQASGGSWGSTNQILFASYMSGIYSVDASGGETRAITTLDPARQEMAHRWPQWLPDGRHFLYSVISARDESVGTFIAAVDDPKAATRIVDVQGAVFVPPGYLVYVRDRVLLVQSFNVAARELTGNPVTLAGDALLPNITNNAVVSATSAGLLAFTGYANRRLTLGWVNRAGEPLHTIPTPADLYNPSLSGDERLLVAGTGRELWLIDLQRDAATRLGRGNTTAFSPDGVRLAYTAGPVGAGMNELHVREAAGSAASTLLLAGDDNKILTDWSPDGRHILYCSVSASTQFDIWAMPTAGSPKPMSIFTTPANECQGRLSPDGQWIAYTSDETGAFEIYVQRFPDGGAKRVVSVGGGSEPQWRADGRELFYLAADGTVMAVAIGEQRSAMARPEPLFRIPLGAGELNIRRNHYIASRDGKRFLVNGTDESLDTLNVLVNWTQLLP